MNSKMKAINYEARARFIRFVGEYLGTRAEAITASIFSILSPNPITIIGTIKEAGKYVWSLFQWEKNPLKKRMRVPWCAHTHQQGIVRYNICCS
jgi:hypothetical protein